MVKKEQTKRKEHQERWRKFQYTKIYKERNKNKDIGIDKPLKPSTRLKWPVSPHYYTVQTAQKLKQNHPFYNYFNYDRDQASKGAQEEPKSANHTNTGSALSLSHHHPEIHST